MRNPYMSWLLSNAITDALFQPFEILMEESLLLQNHPCVEYQVFSEDLCGSRLRNLSFWEFKTRFGRESCLLLLEVETCSDFEAQEFLRSALRRPIISRLGHAKFLASQKLQPCPVFAINLPLSQHYQTRQYESQSWQKHPDPGVVSIARRRREWSSLRRRKSM